MIKRPLILLILLVAVPCWGATIYIDPTVGDGGVGTLGDPFNEWTDVSGGAGFVRGNTYLQKCGTTYSGTLSITTAASDDDTIIISAYNPEDDSSEVGQEVFGATCSGGSAKPIIQDTDKLGNAVTVVADYIEFNSIHIKDGDISLNLKGDYNYTQYCEISGGRGGIRVGLGGSQSDNVYIGYNYIHTDWGHDPVLDDTDGIQFSSVDDSIIEYNVIDDYAHSGINISTLGAEDNEVRYNAVYSATDVMDQFIAGNGTRNKFHHNYCEDCGIIQVRTAASNEYYGNVINGLSSNVHNITNGTIHLHTLLAGENIIDCKIYNNTIYDAGDGPAQARAITLYNSQSTAGVIERNEIYNNIFLGPFGTIAGQPEIYVDDTLTGHIESNPADEDVNLWKNNSFYGCNSDDIAWIEGSSYDTITDQGGTYFNNYGAAYDNLDSDPGLNNVGSSQFWPASASSYVYEAGYDVGAPYDTLLLSTSDFTASPPSVLTDQFANDYIGAYGLVGAAKSYPFQGAAGNFKLN